MSCRVRVVVVKLNHVDTPIVVVGGVRETRRADSQRHVPASFANVFEHRAGEPLLPRSPTGFVHHLDGEQSLVVAVAVRHPLGEPLRSVPQVRVPHDVLSGRPDRRPRPRVGVVEVLRDRRTPHTFEDAEEDADIVFVRRRQKVVERPAERVGVPFPRLVTQPRSNRVQVQSVGEPHVALRDAAVVGVPHLKRVHRAGGEIHRTTDVNRGAPDVGDASGKRDRRRDTGGEEPPSRAPICHETADNGRAPESSSLLVDISCGRRFVEVRPPSPSCERSRNVLDTALRP